MNALNGFDYLHSSSLLLGAVSGSDIRKIKKGVKMEISQDETFEVEWRERERIKRKKI